MTPPIFEPAVLLADPPRRSGHTCRGTRWVGFPVYERYESPHSWEGCVWCGEDGQPFRVHAPVPPMTPFSEMEQIPSYVRHYRQPPAERRRIMQNVRKMKSWNMYGSKDQAR